MGTKNNPGKFDCYANAAPDEPMFILLGRDPLAAELVCIWADIREREIRASGGMMEDIQKIREARDCATALRLWASDLGKPIYNITVGSVNKITFDKP